MLIFVPIEIALSRCCISEDESYRWIMFPFVNAQKVPSAEDTTFPQFWERGNFTL